MAKEAMTGFITEFRYFHQMMPVRPLSASAQALWQYLFYRANAAYWQFPLHLQLNELAGALRLSRSSVQRARAELAEQGYLLYEQEPGSRSVKYYLISNVRPHMLMTPEEMLAGSKSYQAFHHSRDAGPRGGYSCLQRIMHRGCIGELRSTAAGRSAS